MFHLLRFVCSSFGLIPGLEGAQAHLVVYKHGHTSEESVSLSRDLFEARRGAGDEAARGTAATRSGRVVQGAARLYAYTLTLPGHRR